MSLSALADLEDSLVSHFVLPNFASLGLSGSTLLSAIVHDEDVLSILTGRVESTSGSAASTGRNSFERDRKFELLSTPVMASWGQAVLQQDVLDIAAQAVQASQYGALPPGGSSGTCSSSRDADEELAIERSLKGHFGVPRVELLGFGPVQHIREMCISHLQQGLPHGPHQSMQSRQLVQNVGPSSLRTPVATPALISAHALTATSAGIEAAVQRCVQRVNPSHIDRATALIALSKVPPLMDLHHGTHWSEMFERSLGRLEDFLRREAAEAACEFFTLLHNCIPSNIN
jgi:hypothetical protein